MRRSAIVIAFVVTVACRREHDAARSSSSEASAPSSFASTETSTSAASPSAAIEAPSATPSASTAHVDDDEALLRALGHVDMDASIEGASGPGFPVGPTRLPGRFAIDGRVRVGTPLVIGRLPVEVVTRILKRNINRVRICYQKALAANPAIHGGVTVRVVIGSDGTVSSAQDSGSDFPDASTVACVVRAMSTAEFPKPEGGIVVVTAPFVLSAPP